MAVRKYEDIEVFFSFVLHMRDTNANKHLNNLFSDFLPNPEKLFVNKNYEELVGENELLSQVKQQIIDHVVLRATDTVDKTLIPPIINAATLDLKYRDKSTRFMRSSLEKVLNSSKSNSVEIFIGTSHIHFDTSVQPNYLDFTQMSLTPFGSTKIVQPATVSDVVTALTGALQQLPTDMANALLAANVGPTPVTSSSTTTGSTYYQSSYTSLSNLIATFNPNVLDSDVRQRYDNKYNDGNILGSVVKSKYNAGNYYNLVNPKTLILADGTIYFIRDPNIKEYMRTECTCLSDKPSAIRSWYNLFAQTSNEYGFYIHPLWCFRKDHGGNWGFTAGNDPDDDLPLQMYVKLQNMKGVIHRFLCRKGVLPDSLLDNVYGCPGDGYKALKQILLDVHPEFDDQPAVMTIKYPRQRTGMSMRQYFELVNDHLQLKAFIHDTNQTLDQKTEIDVFIHNSKYSRFLNRVTRDERREVSKQYKYTKAQLVETLNKYLAMPDSPLYDSDDDTPQVKTRTKTIDTRGKGKGTFKYPFNKATKVKINAIDTEDSPDLDSPDELEDDLPDEPEEIEVNVVDALDRIQIPKGPESKKLFGKYKKVVQKIEADKRLAYKRPCVVCGGSHLFDDCKVLKKYDFLKDHYIRYCIALRQEATARNKAFEGKEGANLPLPATKPVNAIADSENSDSDTSDGSDFRAGRTH